MSYSRWITSNWYTFWSSQSKDTENRDTAVFVICDVIEFTAKELRDTLEQCLKTIESLAPDQDLQELTLYIKRFLTDVDEEYPEDI